MPESSSRGRDRQLRQHQHFVSRQCASQNNLYILGLSDIRPDPHVSFVRLLKFTRTFTFLLFGIHLHVRNSSGRLFGIHQDVPFPSVWNSPTRSSFIWLNLRNPPGCFISFCSEFTYTFAIHLAESSESTRMLHFLLRGIQLRVRHSFG